jgi:hypothetical protein
VGRFKAGERQGVQFNLGSTVQKHHVTAATTAFMDQYPMIDHYGDEPLAFVGTSFDKFEEPLSRRLTYHGWWLTGLTMATWNPDQPGLKADTKPPPG